jgi:hypothetical protein
MDKFEAEKMDWCEEVDSLAEALTRTALEGDFLTIWQVIEGKRVVAKVKVHHIFTEERLIVLSIPKELKGFKADLEFYVKLKDRDTLFSTNMFKRQKDKLFLTFPAKYRIKENRENRRRLFKEAEGVKVTMRKVNDEVLGQTQFEFDLFDISSTGLGATIGLSKEDALRCVDSLEIVKIGNKQINPPKSAKIIHLKIQGDTLKKKLKIGLKFEKLLDRSFIDDIY